MGFFDAIENGAETAFNWLWDQLSTFGSTCMDACLAALPTTASDAITANISMITPYISMVNAWAPLDFAAVLFAAFLTWFSLYFITKLVVRLF